MSELPPPEKRRPFGRMSTYFEAASTYRWRVSLLQASLSRPHRSAPPNPASLAHGAPWVRLHRGHGSRSREVVASPCGECERQAGRERREEDSRRPHRAHAKREARVRGWACVGHMSFRVKSFERLEAAGFKVITAPERPGRRQHQPSVGRSPRGLRGKRRARSASNWVPPVPI